MEVNVGEQIGTSSARGEKDDTTDVANAPQQTVNVIKTEPQGSDPEDQVDWSELAKWTEKNDGTEAAKEESSIKDDYDDYSDASGERDTIYLLLWYFYFFLRLHLSAHHD